MWLNAIEKISRKIWDKLEFEPKAFYLLTYLINNYLFLITQEFERDKQTYLNTLKTLKNYEELSREQMQRIQAQQLLYEEQMVRLFS